MKCRSQRFKFDLPDEWWAAAGMVGLVTYRTAYRCCAVRRTMIVRIDEIAVPPRGAGVPDFERDRMVRCLTPSTTTGRCRPSKSSKRSAIYMATVAASIAVGFSLVPAVIVRDLDEIKRAEAMAPN